MTRRSPINNRYQKGTTPKGASRRSAASAKPKRPVGEKPNPRKAVKKDTGTKGNKNAWLREIPDTPEYRKYRRMWWYSLGISLVLLAMSLVLNMVPSVQKMFGLTRASAMLPSNILSLFALGFVGYSWWLDFKKIRPLIGGKDATGGSKVEKKTIEKDEAKKSEKEEAKKDEKDEVKKSEKKSEKEEVKKDEKDGVKKAIKKDEAKKGEEDN